MTTKLIFTVLLALGALRVNIALNPTAKIVTDSPIVDAYLGSTIELRCDIGNRPDNIKVEWRQESYTKCKNGSKLPCQVGLSDNRLPIDQQKYGLKFVASDTYILIVKYIDETDDGNYFCAMQVTNFNAVKATVRVRVVDAPSIDPMKTSSDKFVSEGDPVDLKCGAYGIPKPQIRWTRAGNGIMPGGGFSRQGEQMKISSMRSEFRGPYICTALNDIGEMHRIINLDMNFKPEVSGSPARVLQKIGYETKLICHVYSKPVASLSWFVDDTEVKDDSSRFSVTTYQAAFKKVISKLSIYRVSSADYSSKFKCKANNVEGTSEMDFTVEESSTVQLVPGASSRAAVVSQLSYVILLPFSVSLLFLAGHLRC